MKRKRWHSKVSGAPSVCDSQNLRQDISKLLKAGSEQAAALGQAIPPYILPSPASTQEYKGWLLLQGMSCFHPDKIAAPIPIPAVAGKENISIYSSLLLFLSATLFPSTPSHLSSCHWDFCPLQPSCPFFHSPTPHPQHRLCQHSATNSDTEFCLEKLCCYKYPAAKFRIPTLHVRPVY